MQSHIQYLSTRRHLSLKTFSLGLLLATALAAVPVLAADAAKKDMEADTYDQDSIVKDAADFFGQGAEGLAKVIEKAFKEHGRPNGYVKGQEAGGAVTVGLRYGEGLLQMKSGATKKIFWHGPSFGFDVGGNASKVFILVYHLPNTEKIFMRFPAVDGSLYYVGGAGINYQKRDKIVLAPIRLGVGLRAGASVGYVHYTRKKTINPF